MLVKFLGISVLLGCLLVSILRGIGIMDGDFVIPLILLCQIFILGYLVQFLQLVAKDIVVRYTNKNRPEQPPMHTWN